MQSNFHILEFNMRRGFVAVLPVAPEKSSVWKNWNHPVRDSLFEMGIEGESRRSLSEADGEQQKEKKGMQPRTSSL